MANMTLGLVGRKIGMTRVFSDDGTVVPVTLVQAGPCPVTQVKKADTDGYTAVQLGYDAIPERKVTKALKGHLAKAGQAFYRILREFRVDDSAAYELGQELTVDMFKVGEVVKVTGTSKGRGFAGVMKRWNFKGLKKTHGTEKAHRSGGSIGNNTEPGKVMKGRKMAGHMGDETTTYSSVMVIDIRPEHNVIVLKGQVPGANGGLVTVRKR